MSFLKQLRERRELIDAYKKTFSGPHGEKVLAHLLKVSGVSSPQFSLDPNTLLEQQGQRRLAFSILRMVETSEAETQLLIAEEQKLAEQEST